LRDFNQAALLGVQSSANVREGTTHSSTGGIRVHVDGGVCGRYSGKTGTAKRTKRKEKEKEKGKKESKDYRQTETAELQRKKQ
jgi:hypothetical protein